MVAQDQSRLSEANLASSDLNVVSLGESRSGFACISLQAKFHLDNILGISLKRKISRFKRSFIWAVFKLRFSKPFFIQKPNFDPPITQNELEQCLWVHYTSKQHKHVIETSSIIHNSSTMTFFHIS